MNRGFLRAGHWPTLLASFLYFDLSFMVWVLLGPLAVFIAKELHLDPAHKGLMVATPVLAGAFIRVIAGACADRFRPLPTALVMQTIVIAGLLTAWALGISSFAGVLALGVVLGVAGASFAVALPLASSWYPPEYQGTALGIAGAGNSGTVLSALFAPLIAVALGWRNVVGLAALPLAVVLAIFFLIAKESPTTKPRAGLAVYKEILSTPDAWWLMAFYGVTFGGFVGLSSFLPLWFNDQFGVTPVVAGTCTAACVFVGSFARPIGGAIADRCGGVKTLSVVYGVVCVLFTLVARGIGDLALALPVVVLLMAAVGAGNGAVFQIVPQRFARNVGVVTGLVGATGGLGGFYLAASLGAAKQWSGGYGIGFAIFACVALAALATLTGVSPGWRRSWLAPTPLKPEGPQLA